MKWGILATGNIARKFAATVNSMQAAGEREMLVACASRTKDKAEDFAKEFNIPAAYGSYEDMLKDEAVEAVYIATPNNMHFENCKMCLNAGKHVLCEKPFTVQRAEAEALYGLARTKNLFIMEGFWIKFLPALIKLQEIVRSGEIGDVVWARSDYGFIASGARRARKFDPKLAGGALLDIGIYNLGFMRMVMGNENPIGFSVTSHLNEFGTDDFSTIMLSYPGGKSATVTTSIGMNMPRFAAIYGTKGAIYLDDFQKAEKLRICVTDKDEYILEFPILMGGFEYEIREVSECVAKGRNSSEILTNNDTLEILELMEDLLEEMHQ